MSAAFDNILFALKKTVQANLVPGLRGEEFFRQLENIAALDHARAEYFRDEDSRRIFDWVQRFRVVFSFFGGASPVMLPDTPYPPAVWEELTRTAENLQEHAEGDYLLDRIDTWLLESYALPGVCEAEPGDIVLDCGTFTGNTSLYFAQKVGFDGHVYGFEAAGTTFARYAANMAQSPNVTPVRAAVCDHCGEVSFAGDGCGASIGEGGEIVPAVSLDAFCEERGVPRVDFIKMDVEGAEAAALAGAEGIIRRHKPKMALSAYHKPEDIYALPAQVLSIRPDYTFRLRHFSDTIWETVLFCIPGGNEGTKTPPAALPAPRPASDFGRKYSELLEDVFSLFKNSVGRKEDGLLADCTRVLSLAGSGMNNLLARNKELEVENMALRRVLRGR